MTLLPVLGQQLTQAETHQATAQADLSAATPDTLPRATRIVRQHELLVEAITDLRPLAGHVLDLLRELNRRIAAADQQARDLGAGAGHPYELAAAHADDLMWLRHAGDQPLIPPRGGRTAGKQTGRPGPPNHPKNEQKEPPS